MRRFSLHQTHAVRRPCPAIPHNIKIYSLALRKAKGAHEWEKEIKEAYKLYYQGEMVIGRGPRAKGS